VASSCVAQCVDLGELTVVVDPTGVIEERDEADNGVVIADPRCSRRGATGLTAVAHAFGPGRLTAKARRQAG